MKLTDDADVIANHAFKNQRNLLLATKVGFALPAIKEKIVRSFVQRLCVALEARLGKAWAIENEWTETPLLRNSYVAASKPAWKDNVIGLHCEKTGPSELDFFIWLGDKKKMKSPAIKEMREALDAHYAHGRSSGTNPWWRFVDPPYRDWNSEEALLRLWTKKDDDTFEYYVTHLQKICKIAAPFLDKLLVK